jgi:hypothetical protein
MMEAKCTLAREIARSASRHGKLWMYEREGEGKALKERHHGYKGKHKTLASRTSFSAGGSSGSGSTGSSAGRIAPLMKRVFHSRHSFMGRLIPISTRYSVMHSAILTHCDKMHKAIFTL